jgi:CBS domain containing-hemolysin-like protein
MMVLNGLLILLLLVVLTLCAYVSGVYVERGKILSREFQENIDAWEELAEPRLGMRRERIALSAAVLTELSFGCLALVLGVLLFAGVRRPGFAEVAQAILLLASVVIVCHRLLPYVFFVRTRGTWVAAWVPVYRVLFWLAMPVTIALGFLFSVASLAEPEPSQEPVNADEDDDALDALIEAGEEEGIFEGSDSELVRSAVEFGDKVVREVMTPRPRMFAVPVTLSVAQFTAALQEKPYSRVPTYKGTLDNVTGIAFAHDVLQILDTDAATTPLASIQRPASFVPETKRVSELLREMQRQKQHMQIVIDEYGNVAGLVTIEDLLEEIVGDISDEHEHEPDNSPQPDGAGGFLVPGSFELSQMDTLWPQDEDLELPETNATTVGGLVTDCAAKWFPPEACGWKWSSPRAAASTASA